MELQFFIFGLIKTILQFVLFSAVKVEHGQMSFSHHNLQTKQMNLIVK